MEQSVDFCCVFYIIKRMQSQYLTKKKLPDTPGVYYFLDDKKKPIYIGKATSLRDRVKSYFAKDLIVTRGPHILDMTVKACDIKWQETDSVLEALILEANLIKKYKPYYNTKEKDDKSFNYVCLTKDELPKLTTRRGKELDFENLTDTTGTKFSVCYGPYTSGGALREALNIIRKIFRYLDEKSRVKGRYEFYRQLGLVPDISHEEGVIEYKKMIRHLRLFFDGKKRDLIKTLEKEMKAYAKKQEFERADATKRMIFALTHIRDVSLIKEENLVEKSGERVFRIEAYDVAHTSGKNMVGVMTVVVDGEVEKKEYRKFNIKGFDASNDTGALGQMIERRLGHPEWPMPALIVVDGAKPQINITESTLGRYGVRIPIVSVVKDELHRPRGILGDEKMAQKYEKQILLANSEAHRFAIGFHREKRRKGLFGK